MRMAMIDNRERWQNLAARLDRVLRQLREDWQFLATRSFVAERENTLDGTG